MQSKACLALLITVTMIYIQSDLLRDLDRFDWEPLRRGLLPTEISETTNRSHHKDLFPLDSSDFWGTLLVALGSMIAASGGIGGGGMLVPLLILIFGFHPKNAIPLSNFTIVGSSLTNMAMNMTKRHPDRDRPLVDWDLIMVMEPLTMAGAVVGAFAAKVLPDRVLSVSLVVLLAATTKTTLEKGFSLWTKENETFAREARGAVSEVLETEVELTQRVSLVSRNSDGDDDNDDELSDAEEVSSVESAQTISDIKIDIVGIKELTTQEQHVTKEEKGRIEFDDIARSPQDQLFDEIGTQFDMEAATSDSRRLLALSEAAELRALISEEKDTPRDKLTVITGMVLGVVMLNLLKGGKADVFPSPLGIECGSSAYWFIQLSVLVLVLGVSYWARKQLLEKWRTKTRLGYQYAPGDVEWTESNTIKYPFFCFFAGLFAGMFGVGGGIVKGPLMLHMGVHPLVASGTVAVMIMFTSVAATAMFMAFGTLKWDYAWFLFLVGLSTTAIGQFGVSYLVQKYRRVSLVSLSIGAVVAISTALMALQSILSLTDETHAQDDTSVCG